MEHGSGIFLLTQCGSVLARYLGGFGRTCGKWIESWDTECAPLAGVPCYNSCGNDLRLFYSLKRWAAIKPSFDPNGITKHQTWRSVCVDVWSLVRCSREKLGLASDWKCVLQWVKAEKRKPSVSAFWLPSTSGWADCVPHPSVQRDCLLSVSLHYPDWFCVNGTTSDLLQWKCPSNQFLI